MESKGIGGITMTATGLPGEEPDERVKAFFISTGHCDSNRVPADQLVHQTNHNLRLLHTHLRLQHNSRPSTNGTFIENTS